MAYLGWGIYVMATVDSRPGQAEGGLECRRVTSAARTSRSGLACYPSGFQPYRTTHFNVDDWVAAGYKKDYAEAYLKSEQTPTTTRTRAIEPRIPGIFQYYSAAEDELAKAYAGRTTAQHMR